MNILLYAAPASAVVALLFAFSKAHGINRRPEGDREMADIAHAISEGADAFLKSEYKLLLIFGAVVFAGIWVGLGNIVIAAAFLVAHKMCFTGFPVIMAEQRGAAVRAFLLGDLVPCHERAFRIIVTAKEREDALGF